MEYEEEKEKEDKTEHYIEYWKPRQVITQDSEDFEDKHEYQNEESEQDTDKRNARISTFKSPKPILELETWVL